MGALRERAADTGFRAAFELASSGIDLQLHGHWQGTLSPLIMPGIEASERNSRVQSQPIAHLLDFAGIEFGRMRFELEVIDPTAAIEARSQMHLAKPVNAEAQSAALARPGQPLAPLLQGQ